jgi:quercetin dioxygenase-like cupin family protein
MTEAHVAGQTTATTLRPATDFRAPFDLLDLVGEGDALMIEAADNTSRRAAKTLAKGDAMSVVLMAVKGGTDIRDHSAHGAAVVHLLKGQAHFEIGETSADVSAGNAISLVSGIEHRLSVREDALLLLVISATR